MQPCAENSLYHPSTNLSYWGEKLRHEINHKYIFSKRRFMHSQMMGRSYHFVCIERNCTNTNVSIYNRENTRVFGKHADKKKSLEHNTLNCVEMYCTYLSELCIT